MEFRWEKDIEKGVQTVEISGFGNNLSDRVFRKLIELFYYNTYYKTLSPVHTDSNVEAGSVWQNM